MDNQIIKLKLTIGEKIMFQVPKNKAFDNMKSAAIERFKNKDPKEIQKYTGIKFFSETSEFHLSTLGKNLIIKYPTYQMNQNLNEWHQLVILHYMDMADGYNITGKLMNFGELPGGMVRGGGFDRLCEREITMNLAMWTEEKLNAACQTIGGKVIPSNADFCVEFNFLPLYPVTLKIWFADEEIAGTGRIFLDSSASHFLTVEDAVTVGTLILDEIKNSSDILKKI